MKVELQIFAKNYEEADKIVSDWLDTPHLRAGMKITGEKLDPAGVACVDPWSGERTKRFPFSIQVDTDNPTDSRLHTLLNRLPPGIRAAGPVLPTGDDDATREAMEMGLARMRETRTDLSNCTPEMISVAAVNVGRAILMSLGHDAPEEATLPPSQSVDETQMQPICDAGEPDVAGMTDARKVELGLPIETASAPMSTERRRELGLE